MLSVRQQQHLKHKKPNYRMHPAKFREKAINAALYMKNPVLQIC